MSAKTLDRISEAAVVIGLALLATAVFMAFGLAATLAFAGAVLVAVGVMAAIAAGSMRQ